jgi:hypothetical protein
MEAKTNRPGKKPCDKVWDDKISHTYRTSYKDSSDLHILIYLAGDKASDLISAALRLYAKENNIEIFDPALHVEVCTEVGVVFAKTKISPSAIQTMQSIGKMKILKRLHSVIDSEGSREDKSGLKAYSKSKAAEESKTSVSIHSPATEITQDLSSVPAVQVLPELSNGLSVPAQAYTPSNSATQNTFVGKLSKKLDSVDSGMGEEIVPESDEQEATEDVGTLRNRWVSGHDY